jgi:Flp pilus assembly protein TadB
VSTTTPPVSPAAALADLRGRIVAGAPAGDLRDVPPRVRRAVEVALAVGAPLSPALDAAVAALDDDRRRAHAVRVATAQARAVAAGLLALPVLLVPGLGRLLDVDLLGFYATPVGGAVLAVAGALAALGAVVIRALVRRAAATDARRRWSPRCADPCLDETADLVATALAGGTSLSAALRLVARRGAGDRRELERLALAAELGRVHEVDAGPLAPLARVLAATQRWGAPAAASLRALGRDLRAERLADALAAAERLPAQLTFPTALLLLPASVLLLGAPLVADGLATAAGAR